MIHIEQAVVVEGKYDKIKLSSVIDATVIETDGFKIFKDKEKLELIKTLAEKRGVVILTDSDSAGFKIRNFVAQSLPKDRIIHVYIPDFFGKEKRKASPSKEGKLGVEGVKKEVILSSFERAGVLCSDKPDKVQEKADKITKTDLFLDGFCGCNNSQELRKALLKHLSLPEKLSANSLVTVLNTLFTREEYARTINEVKAGFRGKIDNK